MNSIYLITKKNGIPSTLWGININIPIFNSGEGKAKTTQKEINILKTTNQLENVLREISTLLGLLKNDYQIAIGRYEICEKKQQVADEMYKDELKKYELGSSQLMSLSEKKMLVIQAEQELLEKELEIYTLKSQLERYTNPVKNDPGSIFQHSHPPSPSPSNIYEILLISMTSFEYQ